MKNLALAASVALATVMTASSAGATVYVFTAPEHNGTGNIGPDLIASWVFDLLPGERIISAQFDSAFGNSDVPSSAEGFVTVGGVVVGVCAGPGNPCWNGPGAPISYSFLPAEFGALSGGIIDLVYDQTDCCVIRLGESRLQIETAIPEPATWAMMIAGFGLVGAALRRRRTAFA